MILSIKQGTGNVNGELMFTSDIVDTRVVAAAVFSDVVRIPYPVNQLVTNGRSRKLKFICNYSKTAIGASTINFQFVVGGVTLTFTAFSPGVGTLSNETLVYEVDLNFRTANQVHVLCKMFRNTPTGSVTIQTVKTTVLGTWDKTISNDIALQWQVVTIGSHTLTVQQITSELV